MPGPWHGCGGGSAHSERLLGVASGGHRGAQTTLCPSERATETSCARLGRCCSLGGCPGDQAVPPGCMQGRVLRCLCNAGRVPALIQSRDAIGFTSALEIWDGAGRGSVMHQSGSQHSLCGRGSLSQWPARPPMGTIQTLLITVSHRAVRVGHIPHLSSRTPEPLDKRLRSFSCETRDRQNSPRIFTKTGKLQVLHAVKKRGGHRGPGLGPISKPRFIPQPF